MASEWDAGDWFGGLFVGCVVGGSLFARVPNVPEVGKPSLVASRRGRLPRQSGGTPTLDDPNQRVVSLRRATTARIGRDQMPHPCAGG